MPLIHAGGGGAKGVMGGLIGRLAAESGAASIFRRRRRAVNRGFRLEHTPMRFALREHAANFVEMLGRDHRLGWRRNSDLAFDVERGTGRRYVPDQAIDCCPVECIVARFRTGWRRLAVVRSWRLRPGGSIDWFRGPSQSRLLSRSRLRVRNRSNDAGEFYEVINIGDAGHVVSRTQAVVECLAKSMIDALTSLDLWQIFPPRALHARIGLFLKNNNVISF